MALEIRRILPDPNVFARAAGTVAGAKAAGL